MTEAFTHEMANAHRTQFVHFHASPLWMAGLRRRVVLRSITAFTEPITPRVTRSPLSIPIWASPAGTPLPISHLLSSAGYPPPQIPLGWRPPNPPLRRSGPVQPPFLLGRAARVKALRFAEGALRAQRWSLFLKARCTIKCTFILATNNRTPAQPARALAYTQTMQLGPCDM